MGRDPGKPGVAGGPARHIPVLGRRVVEFLRVRDGGRYVDGTFGAGGHTGAILAAANCRVVAIDRDPAALALGADLVAKAEGRLQLANARFSTLDAVAHALGFEQADGVLLDLGVSSMQLDQAERGFSFRLDAPLDMRMGDRGPSAADLVASASERDLALIIATLGEERHARAVARAIVAARREAAIRTTAALAGIVSRVVHARPGDVHPATRTFQALRIFINEELDELAKALNAAERLLAPGGRLVVIAFHSLEDRIVKSFLSRTSRSGGVSRHQPEVAPVPPAFRVLTKRPVVPDESEIAANPRARSAKLRAAERTLAPALALAPADLVPRLPALAGIIGGR